LAPHADLRTDLPRYRVWQDGELVDEPFTVTDVWRADLVTFLIGCSFSYETALMDARVPVRNIEQGRNVSIYRTNVACRPAGRLSGPLGGLHASHPGQPGRNGGSGYRKDGLASRFHGGAGEGPCRAGRKVL